ncbi:putative protein kinase RLK-Pelle-L-LEC family [Helianthus anomalus]
MAPECAVTAWASKESDVYSFEVVALEVACGKKCIEFKAEENKIRLIEWVWELYGTKTFLDASDPCLELEFEEEEIKCLMTTGLWCVHPDPELRPSMRQVNQVLNFETSLPTIPSKMPKASYLIHPISSLDENTDSQKQQHLWLLLLRCITLALNRQYNDNFSVLINFLRFCRSCCLSSYKPVFP